MLFNTQICLIYSIKLLICPHKCWYNQSQKIFVLINHKEMYLCNKGIAYLNIKSKIPRGLFKISRVKDIKNKLIMRRSKIYKIPINNWRITYRTSFSLLLKKNSSNSCISRIYKSQKKLQPNTSSQNKASRYNLNTTIRNFPINCKRR
jgi:hypothetical protein